MIELYHGSNIEIENIDLPPNQTAQLHNRIFLLLCYPHPHIVSIQNQSLSFLRQNQKQNTVFFRLPPDQNHILSMR